MAAFFQSFRSSSMPKRLLRYALARFELLEEESLNLDNLDFALGRNTTFEFKDVGVRLKKLEQLLALPPTFKIQKARVLKLTVTIPMDFYTSPIIIEVDGVDVKLKVFSTEEYKHRSRQSAAKDNERSKLVPRTHDLAASFLETQPLSEKKQLEQALAAETQDLGASLAMTDSSTSDDEPALGTGQPLSLPDFLADFLQGIVDRTQVRVRGVTFQLEVEVPLEVGSPNPDLVTFQIALDRIDVEGVTAEARDELGEPIIQPKEGKRHISLSQIRACLISEANVFSTFARSPSVTSPAISQAPSFTTRASPPPPEPAKEMQGGGPDHLDLSVDLDDIDDALLYDSEEALQIPYDFGTEEPPGPEEENTNTPRASIYHEFSTSPRDGLFRPVDRVSLDEGGQKADQSPLRSPDLESSLSSSLLDPDVESEDAATRSSTDLVISRRLDAPRSSILRNDSPSQRSEEDLAQSQLFTHEDAESMYLSAFSQAGSRQLRSQMPGSWGASPGNSPEAMRPTAHVEEGTPLPAHSETHDQLADLESLQEPEPQPEEVSLSEGTKEHQDAIPQPGTTADDISTPPDREIPLQDELEVSQEDVPTPRGPTRLVKEILHLDKISVYVPTHHKHIQVQPGAHPPRPDVTEAPSRLAGSVAPAMPGAFSIYSSPSTDVEDEKNNPPQSQTKDPQEPPADDSLEVSLSPVEIRFDASLAFLLTTVVGRLLDAFGGGGGAAMSSSRASAQVRDGDPKRLKANLSVENISLLFLNHLGGVADTAERVLGPAGGLHMQPETLLQVIVDNLALSLDQTDAETEATLDVAKFRFGYAKDDIVSFDQSLQMRTSITDKFPSPGSDLTLKMTKGAKSARTEINTLPLLVQLDLQKLDETFGWFGGLSSFLNMSSSVTSSASQSVRSQVQPVHKPRGVRFETPINPDDKSAQAQNKVDMRVGGLRLELRGKDCIIGAETSAVKMVSRESGIGFAITQARLAGPYLRHTGPSQTRMEPPIVANLNGLRFDYQNAPLAQDLERLLELITPSKSKFDQGDDEIMVDTLLRQRRKGAVLRVTLDQFRVKVSRVQQLACLPTLGEELARLATVAKYLPEDDRPGLLTLAKIKEVRATTEIGGKIGTVHAELQDFEVAQITIPSLVALGVGSIHVNRNHQEDIVSSLKGGKNPQLGPSGGPVLMVRIIGDEMEPVIKVKMKDVLIDYRVPTIMDVLGLAEDATPQDFEASLAASVANLGDHAHTALVNQHNPGALGSRETERSGNSKPTRVDVMFRDCMLGLNPLRHSSKLVIVLTDSRLDVMLSKNMDTKATLHINKASLLLTDDVSKASEADSSATRRRQRPSGNAASPQITQLLEQGFVDICYISAAKATVCVFVDPSDGQKQVEIEVRDDLLVLETCADSTQTLIALANGLTPPTPPSRENKYRTKVVPMKDLLASISPEAFGKAEGVYDFDEDFPMAAAGLGAGGNGGSDDEYDILIGSGPLPYPEGSPVYGTDSVAEELFDAEAPPPSIAASAGQSQRDADLHFDVSGSDASNNGSDLAVEEDYFTKQEDLDSKAKIWNSSKNSYDRAPADWVRHSPLRVSVRDVHVIWNLFDGYDWSRTRDEITKTVEEVENKAMEKRRRSGPAAYDDDEEEDVAVIGDYLFNSIYIGIPANRDPRELAQMVNEDLHDNATYTETESVATTAVTATGTRYGTGVARHGKKKLRLNRSRHHKITFELKGVNADLVAYPPGSGETQSSIDLRVRDLEIFDHIPTSTWKKFATYDKDFGEREANTSMARVELLNVQPHKDLAASEMVLRATLLPLRLHVDQDALDFITRFFEFKDDKVPVHGSPSDVPFLQRVEVMDVPVQLDFKPKRVDYGGLKSGRTTEFMNFIILDQAHLTLRHVIIYGIQGFDRMGKTLNDIWMPDVKKTQLPGVLAGLAPVRGLVNIGSGFKDLIEIPVKEYQKDGRIFRSLRMGATAFARTTGTEMVKLGAKVAIGTQTALQGAEGLLSPTSASGAGETATTWDGDDPSETEEQQKQISLYADQPTGVIQGLRGGYASLTRDLHLARDAIIAVPGEVMQSQNAQGLAKVMLRRAPTIVFRPAIGASKAIGKTLMGATNSLDPQNRRRIDEKYKRH